jgi:hypothetical protein
MVFLCPVCGRVKKYNRWKFPDKEYRDELERYKEEVSIVPVKCPVCRVMK